MSPEAVKALASEDHSLPMQDWVKAGSVLFDVAPEIVKAALMKDVDNYDEFNEPKFVKEDVKKAVEKYLKAPATRG